MRSKQGQTPDWRDADAYAPLLNVGRPGFAWEWLRRTEGYRDAAARVLGTKASPQRAYGSRRATRVAEGDEGAEDWGLHLFEAPDRDAIAARPVWCRGVFSHVLEAVALDEGAAEERFDPMRLGRLVTLVRGAHGSEHLLLSDGARSIRLDIVSGTVGQGPVLLRYCLAGLSALQPSLLALRQLLALWSAGRFSRNLHPRERRAARWILLLRTHDALAAGASQRDIAAALLGREAAERRWRVEAPSLRSRAQRLVREARAMAAGGHLSLLTGVGTCGFRRGG